MTVYNIGSINVDHLYEVDHFVRPGETMHSTGYQLLLGGKGSNQSVALAKAQAHVKHVGALNRDDQTIRQQLQDYGVDTSEIAAVDALTGHAIIQLTPTAENSIILHAGANHQLSETQIKQVLKAAQAEDWILLQNETNLVAETLEWAQQSGAQVAFNPAPMDAELTRKVLPFIDLLIVNEVEAMDLANTDSIEKATQILPQQYPELAVMMTLGKDGVRYFSQAQDVQVEAFKVEAKDTTAAGDTFIGFCLAELQRGADIEQAMRTACAASAIAVTRMGAAPSIPSLDEVNEFLAQHS
ncbi:ribokinase [Marinomonas ostreistagni]|uniref:ribokinase n=1 Tax=Marinomonas ostreistagni TaxID=359209 RepID=UPI00194E3137|nr:ribokinase [Marinomonas ostreistagni]MBM6551768.1 ribokinase [Marinomonas ostreistagni]